MIFVREGQDRSDLLVAQDGRKAEEHLFDLTPTLLILTSIHHD
jgi:hypothetical protein